MSSFILMFFCFILVILSTSARLNSGLRFDADNCLCVLFSIIPEIIEIFTTIFSLLGFHTVVWVIPFIFILVYSIFDVTHSLYGGAAQSRWMGNMQTGSRTGHASWFECEQYLVGAWLVRVRTGMLLIVCRRLCRYVVRFTPD